ncbi:hypothetical protein [Magnetospira sp. QH-2]|uniref:hypothetical protein n=1 Tax=Magnetospira sp. (strain QH-2) TaxID=1288970 RepID=UPI0003E81034|nr:hypothetical protein [Magnetospira sp. QH-2]CCQ73913.1 Protein of unknown function [Magnetospira sp. QH-2]
MTSPRLPVKGLRAVATPVDTYHRPSQRGVAAPDTSKATTLEQLGNALSTLNPKLENFFVTQRKQQEAAALAQGAKVFYDRKIGENQHGWNSLMDSLKKSNPEQFEELQGANPHVKRGYEQSFAKQKGLEFHDFLSDEYSKNPEIDGKSLWEIDDAGAMGSWMHEMQRTFAETHGINDIDDATALDHFYPQVRETQKNWLRTNVSERRKQMVDKRLSQVGEVVTSAIYGAIVNDGWLLDPESATIQLAKVLSEQADKAKQDGVRDFKRINDQVLSSVIAVARANNDLDILDILEHVQTSPGSYLSRIPANRAAIEQARTAIKKQEREEILWREGRAEKLRKKISEAVVGPVYQQLDDALLDPEVSVHDLRQAVSTAKKRLSKNNLTADARTLEDYYSRMVRSELDTPLDDFAYFSMVDRIMRGDASLQDIYAGTGISWNQDIARQLTQDYKFYHRREEDKENRLSEQDNRALNSLRAVQNGYNSRIRRAVTGVDSLTAMTDTGLARRAAEAELAFAARFRTTLDKLDHIPDALEASEIGDKLYTSIINDPQFLPPEASDTPRRVLSPEEGSKVKEKSGNAPFNSSMWDALRMAPDALKAQAGTQGMFGETRAEFETYADLSRDGLGPLPQFAQKMGIKVENLIRMQMRFYPQPEK